MELRWYQQECVDALIGDAKKYRSANLMAALPTGTGKSVVIAKLCNCLLYTSDAADE